MRNYVYLTIRKQKTKQKLTSFLHCFMILILIYFSINKIVSSLVKSDFDNAQYQRKHICNKTCICKFVFGENNLHSIQFSYCDNPYRRKRIKAHFIFTICISHWVTTPSAPGNSGDVDFSFSLPMLKAPYCGDSHLVNHIPRPLSLFFTLPRHFCLYNTNAWPFPNDAGTMQK